MTLHKTCIASLLVVSNPEMEPEHHHPIDKRLQKIAWKRSANIQGHVKVQRPVLHF